MKFETLTYSAPHTDFSVGDASVPQIMDRIDSSHGGVSPVRMSESVAAFLLRLAAYLQGYLSSLPRLQVSSQAQLIVTCVPIDDTSEPLQVVRMNRHLSRRMRWLIRRGRIGRSELRVYAPEEGHCNLTPGQFQEYMIRVYRWGRAKVYGLGSTRRVLMWRALTQRCLQGAELCLGKSARCHAPLSPD